VRKEELEHFERYAECACAHGGSKCGIQFTVCSVQTEGTEDKEEQSGKAGKHAEGEADKTVFRCFGSPVGRPERAPDEEQNESKSGKDGSRSPQQRT
jgi:hypothetical protein